jgi:hypothetical protein
MITFPEFEKECSLYASISSFTHRMLSQTIVHLHSLLDCM